LVEFEKGQVPEPSQCVILYCDLANKGEAQKEFAAWITHVYAILEEEGAKVGPKE